MSGALNTRQAHQMAMHRLRIAQRQRAHGRLCAMKVYRYWRNQGFAPCDARLMVGAYLAVIERRTGVKT